MDAHIKEVADAHKLDAEALAAAMRVTAYGIDGVARAIRAYMVVMGPKLINGQLKSIDILAEELAKNPDASEADIIAAVMARMGEGL
jgi:hypothetical protein